VVARESDIEALFRLIAAVEQRCHSRGRWGTRPAEAVGGQIDNARERGDGADQSVRVRILLSLRGAELPVDEAEKGV